MAAVQIGHLSLRNPICTAAGPLNLGEDLPEDQWQFLGAFFTKSITLNPHPGNPGDHLFDAPGGGVINRAGLPNPGVDSFIEHKLPELLQKGPPIIVSIAGKDKWDYLKLAQKLEGTGVSGIEINVSCPNVGNGYPFPTRDALRICLRHIRHATKLPLILKLSATQDIWQSTHLANDCGLDAISLINTIPALTANGLPGGLSGPAIKPIAMRAIAMARSATNLPIIGIGGVSRPQDVQDFFNVGATAVGVGSALLTEPRLIEKLVKSL